MSGRSQRHLREFQGYDSAGETAEEYGEKENIPIGPDV